MTRQREQKELVCLRQTVPIRCRTAHCLLTDPRWTCVEVDRGRSEYYLVIVDDNAIMRWPVGLPGKIAAKVSDDFLAFLAAVWACETLAGLHAANDHELTNQGFQTLKSSGNIWRQKKIVDRPKSDWRWRGSWSLLGWRGGGGSVPGVSAPV